MLFDDPACFRLDRIPVRPIHWLWRPYLACGKLALLDGDPGAGKSLLTADLAARLTRGGRMPDGSWRRRKANVLFLNAEDALDDTLRPRLDAAGADLGRVFCLGGVQVGIADGADMSFPGCFEALRRAVVAHAIELVVIDPMMAFFKPEAAANSDQVMRVALAPLAALAARSGASVLLVRQLTKRGGRQALYRGGGSIGIIGAVRTALFLGRWLREPDRRILAMTKSNIGPTAPALACRLAEEAGRPRLQWLGECDATADELCRPPLPRRGAGSGHGGRMAAGGAGGWAAAGEGASGRGAGGGVLRPDAGAGQAAPRRGRPACAEGRPGILAVVRSGLAARRRTTPMRVRPTDPRRAPCRPYGPCRRRIRSADGTSRDLTLPARHGDIAARS
jgi:AAA domain